MKIISVDFQKEFSSRGGLHYKFRTSVEFTKETLVPFLRKKNIKIAEIISDYRQPRPGDLDNSTIPGNEGYISEIPNDIKLNNVWIKCMNSPVWIRKNIGKASRKPGLPYQNSKKFTKWLTSKIGKPSKTNEIILIGLTLDCCVLCTAQELAWRGYKIKVLEEAVDTYSGKTNEKKQILNNPPLTNWAKKITWNKLKMELK